MVATEIQTATLLRSFLIALVVVAPYAVYTWRRVRARRRASGATPDRAEVAATTPDAPRLEDVIAAIDAIGAGPAAGGTVLVPLDATVDGRPVPPAVVDALVRDALARSGLVATAEVDVADGRRIECVRASAPSG
jgi:hypothetical protein